MKKRLTIHPLILLTSAFLFSHVSYAEDTITLKGSILAPSCDINTEDTTQNISLGEVVSGALSTEGQTSTPVPLIIHLTNCLGLSTIKWTYSGSADASGKNLAINTDGTEASGVAVGIYSDSQGNTPVDLNVEQSVNSTADNYTLNTYLAYKVISLPVNSGSGNATLYVDFTYE